MATDIEKAIAGLVVDQGFKKVGHKARRGRKHTPQPHTGHRKKGGMRDPITRAVKRMKAQQVRRSFERAERYAARVDLDEA